MKLEEAKRIIYSKLDINRPRGYRVVFEKKEGIFLRGDHFPEHGEPLIQTPEEAWDLAVKFAEATRERCVNIYISDDRFNKVSGFDLVIENR